MSLTSLNPFWLLSSLRPSLLTSIRVGQSVASEMRKPMIVSLLLLTVAKQHLLLQFDDRACLFELSTGQPAGRLVRQVELEPYGHPITNYSNSKIFFQHRELLDSETFPHKRLEMNADLSGAPREVTYPFDSSIVVDGESGVVKQYGSNQRWRLPEGWDVVGRLSESRLLLSNKRRELFTIGDQNLKPNAVVAPYPDARYKVLVYQSKRYDLYSTETRDWLLVRKDSTVILSKEGACEIPNGIWMMNQVLGVNTWTATSVSTLRFRNLDPQRKQVFLNTTNQKGRSSQSWELPDCSGDVRFALLLGTPNSFTKY